MRKFKAEGKPRLKLSANKKERTKSKRVSATEIGSEDIQAEFSSFAAVAEGTMKRKIEVSKTDGLVSNFYDWIRSFLFALVIVIFCLTFLFRLVQVKGNSMVSTLENQDMVIVTNFNYTPQNNDIVVISHGAEYDEPIIKRVIAVEGQTLQLDFINDRIIVDGVVLEEDYIDGSTFCGVEGDAADYEVPTVIPEGKIFVMGDNRAVSMDSRSSKIGLIDIDSVIGKAQLVIFPFGNFTYLY